MKPTYHLSLCMAGAVSAGAYTAGVMDYLLEALDRWEKAKKQGDPSVPTHNVVIDIIGGASAGGITSVLTGIALQQKHHPLTPDLRQDAEAQQRNLFFHTWVNLTEKETEKGGKKSTGMMKQMLTLSDLKRGKARSLLNSDFIEEIAERAVKPFSIQAQPRSFVGEETEVFVTMSNLVGVPYRINFSSETMVGAYYAMNSFRDLGHFCFTNKQTLLGRIVVNGKDQAVLRSLRQCAMATSAFPFGLAYRRVDRPASILKKNKDWIKYVGGELEVNWEEVPLHDKATGNLSTFCVDGGLMNNEPFEMAQTLLERKAGTGPAQWSDYAKTNAGIIMIDPFPSQEKEKDWSKPPGVFDLAGSVLRAVRGQLLFKPADIEKAYEPKDASRFMIVPSRAEEEGYKAIACGALEGFSGFLSYDFRYHDYFLGRRNCQKFLQDVFTIHEPMNNPVLKEGYAHPEAQQRFVKRKSGKTYAEAPIIPDLLPGGGKPPEEEKIEWPGIKRKAINALRPKLRRRYYAVIKSSFELKWWEALLAYAFSFYLGQKTAKLIKKELTDGKLLES